MTQIDFDELEDLKPSVGIGELLRSFKIAPPPMNTKVLYPRQELIKKFVDRLNADRGGKFRPLSPAFIASKMYQSGLKNDFLLNWFYGYCNDAKNFSKCWWWSLRAQ